MKTLSLHELRRVAERTRIVQNTRNTPTDSLLCEAMGRSAANAIVSTAMPHPIAQTMPGDTAMPLTKEVCSIVNSQLVERVPWRVWYVAASNGDVIRGEECVTLAVYTDGPGAYPSRLVQFTASQQCRRLRDCCILRANDFILTV